MAGESAGAETRANFDYFIKRRDRLRESTSTQDGGNESAVKGDVRIREIFFEVTDLYLISATL